MEEKKRQYNRTYYLKNAERLRELSRLNKLNNPERVKDTRKKWHQDNPDYNVNYRKNNLEKIKNRHRNYVQEIGIEELRFRNRKNAASRKPKQLRKRATKTGRMEQSRKLNLKLKDRKKVWDLSLEFIESMPEICTYSGVALDFELDSPNRFSPDRVDSSKGYTEDNVVPCSIRINRLKSDMSVDEFIARCEAVTRQKYKNKNLPYPYEV